MISQIGIVFFGVLAAWLTQQANDERKKYACIFGLISQPFWFYSAIDSDQWGIFSLSVIYTGVWLIGFKNYWVKPAMQLRTGIKIGSNKCGCGNNKPMNNPVCFECDEWEKGRGDEWN